jgi:ABC-2 type transport system permease protein
MWPRVQIGMNPIVVKELRSRMRGVRAFAVLTGMLLLLGTVSYGLYRLVLITTPSYSTSPLGPQIGQTLFSGLVFLELMMVCFVTPAVTAGAISGEREKLTYEMLLATPMRPASILWGKLVSALSYVFLLIFAAIPMASLVFIFGGVTPRDMIKALVILVTVAVTLGVVGLFMSTWLGRTGRATVLSYLVVLALLLGPPFFYILVGVLRQAEPPRWLLVPDPLSALFSALSPAAPNDGPSGVFWGLGMALGGNLSILTGSAGQIGIPRPLYHYTLPFYGAISLSLYLLATRLVQPTQTWRVTWKAIGTAIALLLVFGSVVALAFAVTADRYKTSIFSPLPTPAPAIVQPPMVMQEVVIVATQVVPEITPAPTPASTQSPQVLSPVPSPLPAHTEGDQAAIYAAVVRQLYTVDHTFGDQAPNFPIVYLVRTTDDGVGDPDAPRAEPHELAESTQADIIDALQDLPAKFIWVDGDDEVPVEQNTGSVAGGGAIFTLGNVHFQEDGSALVSARLFFAMLGAMGKTYVLEQVDGIWQVTGDTGVQWMS